MNNIFTRQYKQILLFLEVALLIMLLPVAYHFIPFNKATKTFYIPSSDIVEVIDTLKSNGYEVTWIDKMMLQYKKLPSKGWYTVDPDKQGRLSFFRHLHRYKTDKLMDIVIYAGETKAELSKRLANDMKLDEDKLLDRYNALAQLQEAEIFSGRYTIARKADEKTTMEYLFRKSRETFMAFEEKYFKHKLDPLKQKILFTIASIIQKESNSVKEMPLISSVIYNRLEKKMKLQMDGTLNYGKYAHTVVTPERIKNDESLYNTYKHKGLPPHPLSSISLDALIASVTPTDSDYIFFMLNKDGTHDFSATYAQHLEYLKAFRKHQKERKRLKALQVKNAKEKGDTNSSEKKSFGLKFDKLTFE